MENPAFKVNQLRSYPMKNKLRYLRWWNGYTQQKLAEIIGCSQSAVSMWENGNCVPYGQTLEKIIEIYHLPSDFFE